MPSQNDIAVAEAYGFTAEIMMMNEAGCAAALMQGYQEYVTYVCLLTFLQIADSCLDNGTVSMSALKNIQYHL